MYVLALLFGIVNFYFLLSALIVILSLFTEFVQVPLINWGAKLFHLPIAYNLERSFPQGNSNPNVFNTIFNQEKKVESEQDESNDDVEDDEEDDTNEDEQEKQEDANQSVEEKQDDSNKNSVQTENNQDDTETEPSDNENEHEVQNQLETSNVMKTDTIVIDESLD